MKIEISTDSKDIDKVMEVVKTFGATPENLKMISGYIEKELAELGDNRILFIGSVKEQPVGAVQLLIRNTDNRPNLADGKSIAHVHALQIGKNSQRSGYGEKMMFELEVYSKKKNISRLTLGVDGDNQPALNLYKKLGYSLLEKAEGKSPEVPRYYFYKDLC